jgi:hypothetical protein
MLRSESESVNFYWLRLHQNPFQLWLHNSDSTKIPSDSNSQNSFRLCLHDTSSTKNSFWLQLHDANSTALGAPPPPRKFQQSVTPWSLDEMWKTQPLVRMATWLHGHLLFLYVEVQELRFVFSALPANVASVKQRIGNAACHCMKSVARDCYIVFWYLCCHNYNTYKLQNKMLMGLSLNI